MDDDQPWSEYPLSLSSSSSSVDCILVKSSSDSILGDKLVRGVAGICEDGMEEVVDFFDRGPCSLVEEESAVAFRFLVIGGVVLEVRRGRVSSVRTRLA
jgi:hypothetical protein